MGGRWWSRCGSRQAVFCTRAGHTEATDQIRTQPILAGSRTARDVDREVWIVNDDPASSARGTGSRVRGVSIAAVDLRVGDLFQLAGPADAGAHQYALVARVTTTEHRVLVVVHDLHHLRRAVTSYRLGDRITLAARGLIRNAAEPGPWSSSAWSRAICQARGGDARSL